MLRKLKKWARDYNSIMQAWMLAKSILTRIARLFLRIRKIKYLSASDYLKAHEGRWHAAYKSMPARFVPVTCFGSRNIDFSLRICHEFPEVGVLELPGGYIHCPQGWVYSKERILLPEFSWYGMSIEEMNLPFRLRKPKVIKGRVLSLLSDFGDVNYGHFLLDCMGRYHLYTKAGFSIDNCDHILIPGKSTPVKNKLLRRLKIPIERCIWSDGLMSITADVVLVPSFPGVRRNYPQWLATFLRESFNNPLSRGDRRIYLSRQRTTRNVKNFNSEILPILNKYMFEVYYPEDHERPEEDFAQAAIIAGPHGAALTDIVYCFPGTKVLELVPSDHVYPYFYTLASAAKLHYYCLQGVSTSQRGELTQGPSLHDFYIDPSEFETAIRTLVDGQ